MGSYKPKKKDIDFEKIKELVSKYEHMKALGEIRRLSETDTRDDFVTPLFKALGWNMENGLNRNDSVSKEENIAGKRSDYGFRINQIPKFFLEAKSLKEDDILFGTGYDKQAVNYAWLKSCSWAVLTNFRWLAVYNADSGNPKWAFTLQAEEYLSENGKEKLKLLSKNGFENELLDRWALDNGKKPMKRPVDRQLLQDMLHFREILSKDIKKNNPHVFPEDIDETVQRTLDRLVFIRNTEDREYEPKELKSNYNQWSRRESGHLIRRVRELYQHYREVYNSGLFGKDSYTIHISDQVEISNDALAEVIQGLYSPAGANYAYDFSVLDTDVLGKIYEQYLGNLLKQTPKRAKLETSKVHRKEQGIYYTPSYIVDYIVQHTIGEYIKRHTSEEIRNVKILDPACGSGSFLIRAYKELEKYWRLNSDFAQLSLDSKEFYSKKVEILKNNIFGVDLDPKAVEIAQLNLLLQISESKQRLPVLQNNIRVGNALIDSFEVSERAFKWEIEFPEIMRNGGFDIVIGNPPYINVEKIPQTQKNFLKQYQCYAGKSDILYFFYNKGISLLKNGGILGFITSRYFIEATYAMNLRKYILDNCDILRIVDLSNLSVFQNVGIHTVIVVLKKNLESNDPGRMTIYQEVSDAGDLAQENVPNTLLDRTNFDTGNWILGNREEIRLFNLIDSRKTTNLGNISKIEQGQKTGLNKAYIVTSKIISEFKLEEEFLRKLVKNSYIKPYFIEEKDLFLIYASEELTEKNGPNIIMYLQKYREDLMKRAEARDGLYPWYRLQRPRSKELFDSKEKIIVPYRAEYNRFGYDDQQRYNDGGDVRIIVIQDREYPVKYILAILNSKLMNFYYRHIGRKKGTMLEYFVEPLQRIPIFRADKLATAQLVRLVDEILLFNKESKLVGRGTDKEQVVKEQIDKVKSQIDELVCEIYGLTDKETRIVNGV